MVIRSEKIPSGSYEVRIWRDGDDWEKDPILTVLNLKASEDDPTNAVVSMAHGHLSNEINIMVAREALRLGFLNLTWYVASGDQVTRWAELVKSDGVYDWYKVDLVAAIAIIDADEKK